jgi:hypothetical protein
MEKTLLEKEWGVSSFSKLQTCIQINKNTKVKKKNILFLLYEIIIKTENTYK